MADLTEAIDRTFGGDRPAAERFMDSIPLQGLIARFDVAPDIEFPENILHCVVLGIVAGDADSGPESCLAVPVKPFSHMSHMLFDNGDTVPVDHGVIGMRHLIIENPLPSPYLASQAVDLLSLGQGFRRITVAGTATILEFSQALAGPSIDAARTHTPRVLGMLLQHTWAALADKPTLES
jgi:hypothetical protein